MEEFQINIKEWVAIDTQLKALNEQVKELRGRRTELAEDIHMHVNTHNLNNAIVNISDGKLRFGASRQTTPLTLKYIQECLHSSIENPEQVAHIMKMIKESRSINVSPEIKRTYND